MRFTCTNTINDQLYPFQSNKTKKEKKKKIRRGSSFNLKPNDLSNEYKRVYRNNRAIHSIDEGIDAVPHDYSLSPSRDCDFIAHRRDPILHIARPWISGTRRCSLRDWTLDNLEFPNETAREKDSTRINLHGYLHGPRIINFRYLSFGSLGSQRLIKVTRS